MLEYIILGFLMHGDMSGYDMKQFMSESTAYFYNASFGSIYPMLKKLEEERCVTLVESIEGGKYKKLYSITPAGRERFLEWLEKPIEFNRSGYAHLIHIFFYGWLEPAKARALINDYVAKLEAELEALKELEGAIRGEAAFYEFSTLDYGKGYYEYTIGWCRQFIEKSICLEQAGELKKRGLEKCESSC
jgi:DNA-binding PadR family transcriptional regulator